MKSRRLLIMVLVIPVLLLIPLIAMLFSPDVQWNLFDFVIAGTLLVITVLSIELVLRVLQSLRKRLVALSILFIILALIWIELAVGIVDSPFAGN